MSIASRARPRRRDLIPGVLAGLSAAAFAALALGAGEAIAPAICGRRGAVLAATDLQLVMAPWRLAAGWLLMLAAMTPLVLAPPIRHLWDRSFADRRWATIAVFSAGYLAVWMAAGLSLLAVDLACRGAGPLALFGLIALGLAWQASPAKQACLNRCHRRPALAAFGPAAAQGALAYGVSHGAWCAGACWPLMLAPLLLTQHQLPVMAGAALFMAAERLDLAAPLEWRLRVPVRALRILRARMRPIAS